MINNEKRERFIDAFLSGTKVVSTDSDKVIRSLTGLLYDERAKVKHRDEVIAFCDSHAREFNWTMECHSCEKDFAPDCELSEMFGAEVYCGGSERCCP